MTPCQHRVFGIRPCTRPLDHPMPHVGDFTPQEEPMTIRPRYTLRAKARDAARLYAGAIAATLPTLRAIAHAVIPALVEHTAWIARTGYVDPPTPPTPLVELDLRLWLEAVGVDERDHHAVAAAIDHLAEVTWMPEDEARSLVAQTIARDLLDVDTLNRIMAWGYPLTIRLFDVRSETPEQLRESVEAGQVTAWDLIHALTPESAR